MLALHVLAGLVALLAGAFALSAPKGGPLHRRSGRAFALAMLAMTGFAIVVASGRGQVFNIVAAGYTAYLVTTGWLALQPATVATRRADGALLAIALLGGLAAVTIGTLARARGHAFAGTTELIFGTLALLAAVGDIRRTLRGGDASRAGRLVRHLWRMTLAMFIATMSLFLGQARQFPDAIRHSGVLYLPVLLVVLAGIMGWRRVRARAATKAAS